MKKLTKAQVELKEELVTKLEVAYNELVTATTDFRDNMQQQWEETVTEKINAYNEVMSEAEEFKQDIVSAQEEYVGNRSDKWHESDAASTYQDWASSWSELDFEQLELEMPSFEEFDDESPSEKLEQAPDEIEG